MPGKGRQYVCHGVHTERDSWWNMVDIDGVRLQSSSKYWSVTSESECSAYSLVKSALELELRPRLVVEAVRFLRSARA